MFFSVYFHSFTVFFRICKPYSRTAGILPAVYTWKNPPAFRGGIFQNATSVFIPLPYAPAARTKIPFPFPPWIARRDSTRICGQCSGSGPSRGQVILPFGECTIRPGRIYRRSDPTYPPVFLRPYPALQKGKLLQVFWHEA